MVDSLAQDRGRIAGRCRRSLAQPIIAEIRNAHRAMGKGRGPASTAGSHEAAELWRLLGSLELLNITDKIELGDLLLNLAAREKTTAIENAMLWSLGRMGARVPLYGPLNTVVSADVAQPGSNGCSSASVRRIHCHWHSCNLPGAPTIAIAMYRQRRASMYCAGFAAGKLRRISSNSWKKGGARGGGAGPRVRREPSPRLADRLARRQRTGQLKIGAAQRSGTSLTNFFSK